MSNAFDRFIALTLAVNISDTKVSTEFEKQIKAATGRVPTEKDKMVTAAVDILTGLGYGSFQDMARSKIRSLPDKQIHDIRVHLLEVLA